jgi:Bacterial Ig-like domain (group 3)/FG-GAP-like repeat
MPRLLLLLLTLVCPSVSAFAACTFDLMPPVDFPTELETGNLVVARLNGDDFYDAALRVSGTDRIAIMLGTAGGGFGEPTEISIGRETMSGLEAGDLNKDGITDLVTSNSWVDGLQPAVLVLLGKGDGTFHPAIPQDVFQNPMHLSLADFNHDGKLDVAATKDSAFVLLLGQGDGTLVQKADVTLLPDQNIVFDPDGITHGDFDKDGHLDVVVSERIDLQAHVFYGVGNGSFVRGPRLQFPSSTPAMALTAGDYDGDGDADLAYGEWDGELTHTRDMVVHLSNGNARTFQEGIEYGAVPGGSFSARSADIDADGDLDVILSAILNVTIMFNAGDGTFPTQEEYGSDGFDARVVDVDQDGGLDVVVSGLFTPGLTVLRNFCSRVGLELTSAPNPSTVNANATFTATVVPPDAPVPTGTLTLKRGDNVIATGDLADSLTVSATLNTLPAGTYNITALYSGDTHFRAETKKIKHVVELPPFGTPTNLSASSTGGPVMVTWTGTKGVEHYEVWRSGAGAGFALLTTTPNQSFFDATASPSAGWLYKVRGIPTGGGTPSAFSNADLASTFTFTDETITIGVTKIRGTHVTELRNAVDSARVAAGLGVVAWTDPTPVVVKAIHLTQLRTALDQARAAAGMPPGSFTTTPATGAKVKALDVTQLRAALR